MKFRIENLGRVFVPKSGALVIMGKERLRGDVAITFPVEEARWLLASLKDLERQGLLNEPAGQSQGAYLVESLGAPS